MSTFMKMNVILTFDSTDADDECQEMFDTRLPLKQNESAINLLNSKFFKQVAVESARKNRDIKSLVKISTCSDWDLFTAYTSKPSLADLGHSCKWHFGNGRRDLDFWEKELMHEYGFGTNADMSYVNEHTTRMALIKLFEDLKLSGDISV